MADRAVAMNRYQHEWETYRARKRRLFACAPAMFVGFFPFLLLVAFVDRALFSSTSLVGPAGLLWGTLYMFLGYRLRVFPCPRCGKNFFAGIFHDPASFKRWRAFLGRECVHCSLGLFADSDDAGQASAQESRTRVSAAISSSLRTFLGGVAGTLVGSLFLYLSSGPSQISVLERTVATRISSFRDFLASPYWVVPCFLIVLSLAIYKREAPQSWVYGVFAGLMLPEVIFHYVLHWI